MKVRFAASATAEFGEAVRWYVAAIEAGTENLEPWEEVRRRIEREILNR